MKEKSLVGQSVYFIHGFLGANEDWDDVFSHLPKNEEFHRLSLPTSGDLSHGILEELPPNPVTLVGYSMGGRLALKSALLAPERVQKVILISTSPGIADEKQRRLRRFIDTGWITMLKNEKIDLFLERWYNQPLFVPFKQHACFSNALERRKKIDVKGAIHQLEQFSVSNEALTWNALHKVPAHWIFGKDDLKYVPIYRRITDLKMSTTLIPECGHVAHLESPELCAQAIQEYL